MNQLMKAFVLLATLTASPVYAQQAKEFDDYTIHYSAMNSSFISPEIANTYGIRRSDSRALINISVLKSGVAAKARVTATGRNLTGQTRTVEMREVSEGDDAIYYLGELSVRNMEMFDFTVLVIPEGKDRPYTLKFRQQFYTE